MNTPFHRMAQSSPPGIGKAVVGKEPEPGPGKVGVKVKAAIFFDGTGNNQNNITKRLKDSSYQRHRFNADDWASYEQYYSNVAILYFMHKKKVPGERIVSLYMEGIGTSDDGPDNTAGGAFGAGTTGVVKRVNEGISRLTEKIKGKYGQENRFEYLEELTVYAFGFSRGAAAARHFCARRADSRGRLNSLCQALGVKPDVVNIKFVGLFDSVSSFDETGEYVPSDPVDDTYKVKAIHHYQNGDKEFRNDVPELHLTLDDPTLGQVVHLAAADEYRMNFSGTTIASALQRKKGFELRLPGAHSDVGGGYAQTVPEEHSYAKRPRVFAFFHARGWYAPEHLRHWRQGDAPAYPIGTRRVPNTYQYVALSIMLKLAAAAQSGLQFGSPNQDDERGIRYIIDAAHPLFAAKAQLEAHALAQFAQRPAEPVLPALPAAAYQWLRQRYLHLSWSDRLGMEYRLQDGLPHRLVLPG